jgi:hypothetical protein
VRPVIDTRVHVDAPERVRGGGVPAVPECQGRRPPSMTVEYARTEWDRALEALAAATLLLAHGGFDSAASRAPLHKAMAEGEGRVHRPATTPRNVPARAHPHGARRRGRSRRAAASVTCQPRSARRRRIRATPTSCRCRGARSDRPFPKVTSSKAWGAADVRGVRTNSRTACSTSLLTEVPCSAARRFNWACRRSSMLIVVRTMLGHTEPASLHHFIPGCQSKPRKPLAW